MIPVITNTFFLFGSATFPTTKNQFVIEHVRLMTTRGFNTVLNVIDAVFLGGNLFIMFGKLLKII